jgi:hypothetical protein
MIPTIHTWIIFILLKKVMYHHLLSFIDRPALGLLAIPWAKIFLAIPHKIVVVTSLYWPLTIAPHDLQAVELLPLNGYRMPQ